MPKTIAYLYELNLFSGTPDSINVLEMCHAFTQIGYRTLLITPTSSPCKNSNTKKIRDFYGVNINCEIVQISLPKKIKRGKALLFAIYAITKIMKNNDYNQLYTRNPWIYFFISTILRLPIAFEAHQYRYRQVIHTYVYRFLIKAAAQSKSSRGINAISNKLKE